MTNALITIAAIVSHTPVWAWLILALLIWRGLGRTQPREVGLGGLVLLPMLLIGLAVYNLTAGVIDSATIAGIGLGALLGVAGAMQLERRFVPMALGNGRLLLPGEWTSLITGLVVFGSRYVKITTGIINPALARSDVFVTSLAALSAFFAVMTLVRTIIRLRMALAPQVLA